MKKLLFTLALAATPAYAAPPTTPPPTVAQLQKQISDLTSTVQHLNTELLQMKKDAELQEQARFTAEDTLTALQAVTQTQGGQGARPSQSSRPGTP